MLVPISWLKDFVDIDIPIELLAERLTLAGLEVSHIQYIGVPQGFVEGVRWPKSDHLVWDREKIVLGAVREVKSHPDADRLVLAMVDYGGDELEQCVTGAPNLFEFKDAGPLDPPLWSPFAKEGAEVWDGHSDAPKRMKLKGRKIRGVYNKSMVCSEKELGITDEHEGILLLDNPEDYAPGTPMQDVLGDVLLDVDLTPNLARCFSMIGVAREVAALLGVEMRHPSYDFLAEGPSIDGQAMIEIHTPELNPRFTLTLLRDTEIRPSPMWMQHRLKLVGQRPINNIVDVTNYITFELGQPLHAFDYDKLVERAGGAPTIITRLPEPGEKLETLDEEYRELQDFNILVCDTAGALSIGGIIGGAETEISDETTNVLLEAANWNFINVRRSMRAQKVQTDAGTRFSRGVHPSQAILGVQRGIELMRQTGGGTIAEGVIDEYPLPPETVQVDLPIGEVTRLMGIDFSIEEAADILVRLLFDVTIEDDMLHVAVPDHRMDVGEGVIGQADLVEEIARIYGYDRIPDTIMADEMPPQWANVPLEQEELARDLLANLGLREVISYRFTTPEAESLLAPEGAESSLPDAEYVRMENPVTDEKTVLRHTLLISLLEAAITNARFSPRQQIFEVGSVYLQYDGDFPEEPRRLGILMTGPRKASGWLEGEETDNVDFFDLKGLVEGLLKGLHIEGAEYVPAAHTSFHPGCSALLRIGGKDIGTFGELHPIVARQFGLEGPPLMMAEFDLDTLLSLSSDSHKIKAPAETPPVLQDIALIVAEATPAAEVETVIVRAGGKLLAEAKLFDVYRGENIPEGHKSLAYNLVYRDLQRTLTDKEVAKAHKKIVKAVEHRLKATVRK